MTPRAAAPGRAIFVLLIALPPAAGCADEAATSDGAWVATTDTVGDTAVVRTVSGSFWSGDVRLVEELRIGVVEGEDAYTFGRVGTVAADPQGRIHVVDEQVPAVRVFDGEGIHLFDAGGQGGGPGEYERPRGVAFLPGGRWAVYDDSRGKRLHVYGPDGAPFRTLTFTNPFSTYGQPFPLHSRADGAVAVPTMVRQEGGSRAAFLWVAPNGSVTDTLLQPRDPTDTPPLTIEVEFGTLSWGAPMAPHLVWTLDRAGHPITATGAAYAITLHDPEGHVRFERATEPVILSPEERRERAESYAAALRANAPDYRWRGEYPERKPFIRGLLVDADGRVWVRVHTPSERRELPLPPEANPGAAPRAVWYEPQRWDLFEPDGRYLGAVDMPDDFTLHFARGEHVWGVLRDELGVNYVVRMRLERGPAAGA